MDTPRNQRKSIGDDWTQQTIRDLMKRKIQFAGHILRGSEGDVCLQKKVILDGRGGIIGV